MFISDSNVQEPYWCPKKNAFVQKSGNIGVLNIGVYCDVNKSMFMVKFPKKSTRKSDKRVSVKLYKFHIGRKCFKRFKKHSCKYGC